MTESANMARRRSLLQAAWALGWGAGLPAWAQPAGPLSLAMLDSHVLQDQGAPVTVFPAPGHEADLLTLDSVTDTVVFAPAVRAFQRRHPHVTVRYADRGSLAIHARALAHAQLSEAQRASTPLLPDLLISSSLDLQTQLVNDGHALAHRSEQTLALPSGAHWRHEVFSLGAEPVVMVYQPRLLAPERAPQTRSQLLALLRERDGVLQGRVGMYDASRSGLGYLLATQDARLDSTAGVMLAALGSAAVVLGEHINPLLEELERGRLALLYNVPASYAHAKIVAGSSMRIIYPQDYTLLTTRSALIPTSARRPDLARRFLDLLLSDEGQAQLAREQGLLPIRQAFEPAAAGSPALELARAAWRPLVPGLGLLVYLDALKRQRFLQAWRAAVQAPD
jgi:iron(III) transport system substrate-binding protein